MTARVPQFYVTGNTSSETSRDPSSKRICIHILFPVVRARKRVHEDCVAKKGIVEGE
jgi:hypothetical protein